MIRVRAGNTYAMPFVVNLGQRNAEIVNGHLTPLRRFLPKTGAFTIIPFGNYDLIHSMNAIPLGRRPFIVTFEDWMPRTPPDHRSDFLQWMLTKRIAHDQCIALLAMSHYAHRQMSVQNRRSPLFGTLLKKTEVLYPAVSSTNNRPKTLHRALRLLFVGADFMRKGLPALLIAHNTLEQYGIPVETTVVSSLRWHTRDYVGPRSRSLVEDERAQLRRSTINIIDHLPNQDVLKLMREHDFLVLPTFHDTFGFVTLEAMARGTPVIGTATCALPEIIEDGQNGILLPFDNDGIGRWRWLYRMHRGAYTNAYLSMCVKLGTDLVTKLIEVWETPQDYEAMSAAALQTVATKFHQRNARDRLELLYDRAVQTR